MVKLALENRNMGKTLKPTGSFWNIFTWRRRRGRGIASRLAAGSRLGVHWAVGSLFAAFRSLGGAGVGVPEVERAGEGDVAPHLLRRHGSLLLHLSVAELLVDTADLDEELLQARDGLS